MADQPPTTFQAVAAEEKRQGDIHVPGEFPAETPSEDVNDPTAFPGDGRHSGLTAPIPLTESKQETGDVGGSTAPLVDDAATQPTGLPSGSVLPLTEASMRPEGAGEEKNHDTAALAGGAGLLGTGAAGAGIYAATRDHGEPQAQGITNDPGMANIPPTSSEAATDDTMHPGFGTSTAPAMSQPEPAVSQPTSDIPPERRTDERTDHTGRNAVLGLGTVGAGAAGYGAYEASKDSDIEPGSGTTTAPVTSKSQPVGSQAAPVISQPEPVPASSQPTSALPSEQKTDGQTDSTRNTALAGAGVVGGGAAGYGVYEATKDKDVEPEKKQSTFSKLKEKLTGDKSKDDKSTEKPAVARESKPVDERPEEQHDGRTAAAAGLGAAGAGAAGYGIYEATKDDNQGQAEALRQQQLQREQAEAARKAQEEQTRKMEKEREKEAERQKKEYEKAQKEHEKQAEKERKEEEKHRKEEQKRLEKEREQREAMVAQQKKGEEAERKRREEELERRRLAGEEEERLKREQAESESHLGRDTAIGAAGVAGVAGTGGALAYMHDPERENDAEKTPAQKLAEYEDTREVEPKKTPGDKIKGLFSSSDKSKDEEVSASDTHDVPRSTEHDSPAAVSTTAQPLQHEHASHADRDRDAAMTTGGAAAAGGLASQFGEVRSSGDAQRPSYENPELTPAQRLAEYERIRAEKGLYDHHAQKKPGLIHRILHPGESRKSSEGSPRSSTDRQTQHIGTDGPIGDTERVSGQPSAG